MPYYRIAILGSPLEPLTFSSPSPLEIGCVVSVALKKRAVAGVVVEEVEMPSFEILPVEASTQFYLSGLQRSIAGFMASYYLCSLGEAMGLVTPFCREIVCRATAFDASTKIILSTVQQSALEELRLQKVSLLFGDTGSGKTEIYMKYFESLTCKGKRCLFLLPEIALTPQMQRRLEAHFGNAVVLWHSKMTKAQKEKALQRIRSGEAMIIAGPRSALFLPITDLGLIVVDEEHDDSYKSSSRPRYHARDVAITMGKLLDIPVVLGSATPSLSSYVKFPHVRLRGGYHEASRHFVFEPSREAFTPLIEEALSQNAASSRQAIMFLPTRANFKYLICAECGYTLKCPFCSVGMSLHVRSRALKCHYCGYSEPIPTLCPKCGSTMLENSRLGTAEAIAQCAQALPQLRIAQFDRDAITTQNKLEKTLEAFNTGEIDLLIGTQMLSKGHDYHDVTLAVVLGLDNMLHQNDYRAREKTLALLIQIAGRAGRKHDATVIVQSFYESFFRSYLEDYEHFLQEEQRVREGLYPPYRKLARLLFAHAKRDKAEQAMLESVSKLRAFDKVQIVGYGAAVIERIAGKYRFAILLRSERSTDLIRAIKASKHKMAEVDMDPVEFG
ncbi:MAG: primosomal protein N' [Campylobacterales bacterium]|nr:primosomal protein N' [Campylobacterales bacterium]